MSHFLNTPIKKPKYLVTTHTSVQATSSASQVDTIVSGSEITYTPDVSASKVVYEISYYGERKNYNLFQSVYLEHYVSGSWSEINEYYRRNTGQGGTSTQQTARYYLHYRFILPAWSGSRQLRLNTKAINVDLQINLHQLTDWEGSSATDKFCNTNLLVYSI
tara:strand:+ start:508 stop:993 length:486 start_codon:yes stop_codon:yes gene_type:complete